MNGHVDAQMIEKCKISRTSQNRRHVFSRERTTGASLSGDYGILYRPKIVLSRCVTCKHYAVRFALTSHSLHYQYTCVKV